MLKTLLWYHRYPWKSSCVHTWPEFFPYAWQPYSKALCKSATIFTESLAVCGCYPPLGTTNGILEYDISQHQGCFTPEQQNCARDLAMNISNKTHKPKLLEYCNTRCISGTYEVKIQYYCQDQNLSMNSFLFKTDQNVFVSLAEHKVHNKSR